MDNADAANDPDALLDEGASVCPSFLQILNPLCWINLLLSLFGLAGPSKEELIRERMNQAIQEEFKKKKLKQDNKKQFILQHKDTITMR